MRRNKPHSSLTLSEQAAGVWRLSGVLDMRSVPTLRNTAPTLIEDRPVLVDLAEVTRMDSAGLALLVDWQGEARRRHTDLRFRNIPTGITAIAEVYGLGGILPLAHATVAEAPGAPRP